ncbi:MAG: MATE family efflux transporter [Denitrobacterium sp.]|nr:MATE family efflux transporter [Denitrobacterium sp.]
MTTDMDRHFTMGALVRYTLPSICMVIFMSIYGVVDGLFVSNFAGTTAFAAVNLIMPFIMILATCGSMIGTGGSALVGKTRGEGDDARANALFSEFVIAAAAIGTALAIVGAAFMPTVAQALGASGDMLDLAVTYGRICMISLPCFILQYAFQILFVTAGKPKLGFGVIVVAGVANIVLDALLVGLFGWGVKGAAIATVISEFIGGLVPMVYFLRKNSSYLRLGKPARDARALGAACVNGSSEMASGIASSVVSMLYNLQLLAFAGEAGVAAYGVIMYVFMIFSAIYIGFTFACEPLISYQYGARRTNEVSSLLQKSLAFTAIAGAAMFLLAQATAPVVAATFVGYDPELAALTEHGFRIYSFAFLLMGVNIFASGFFTALNNGKVSAIISFLRTLVFETSTVMLLPLVLGLDGVWMAVDVAEIAALAVSAGFLVALRSAYGYKLRP